MNSHRFSGRVESASTNGQVKPQIKGARSNDSLPHLGNNGATRKRLTPRQLEEVRAQLSERDLAVIKTVGALRLLTTSQIQRLIFVDGTPQSNPRLARGVLQRLTNRGLLIRLDRRIGGVRAGSSGHIYALTAAGQHVLDPGQERGRRRVYEPGLPYVAHRLAVSELAVRLREAARAGRFELIEFLAEPDCWRSFFGPGGARLSLKPDAFVRLGRERFEELAFVEVDRATQAGPALAKKFLLYRKYWATGREQSRWGNVFPRVVWLVPTSSRLRQVIDIAGKQPPEAWPLFRVRLYDEAIEALAYGENHD